jgi:hypothetical protein
MASNTANMGLRSWDSAVDLFAYTELANNWSLVDLHDHSSGKGVQIPTAGIANLAVTGPKLAAGAISDATKIVDGSVSDAKLASSSLGAYKTLAMATAATFFPTSGDYYHVGTGSLKRAGAGLDASGAHIIPIRAADLVVPGKSTVLRLRVNWATNAVAPTVGFTSGIWPIATSGGTSGNTDFTTGSRLGDATLAAPSASSFGTITGTDFALPTDGNYLFGARFLGGTMATNSVYTITTFLQYRYV